MSCHGKLPSLFPRTFIVRGNRSRLD